MTTSDLTGENQSTDANVSIDPVAPAPVALTASDHSQFVSDAMTAALDAPTDNLALPAALPAALPRTASAMLGTPPPEVAIAANGETRAPPVIGDKYVVERELARGAMGRIYLATQKGLNRKVAVKVMSPKLGDEDFRRRFMLEATGLANLSHRNIVTVYDYGETAKGMLYLVLEYLEGMTLAQALKVEGPMTVARACAVSTQLLRGLRVAHKKGIVHRDLKPSNIFLVQDGDGDEEVKVLDFGVAKLFSTDGDVNMADATRDGVLLGTPAFMSPEQIDGTNVGPSTDLYALGVVMYQMLSGRLPFTGKNEVEVLFAHLREQPPALRGLAGCEQIPEQLAAYVHKLLAKSVGDRYADASESLDVLQSLTTTLMAVDPDFRAQVTPELAQNFMSTSSTNGGSTGARRPAGLPSAGSDTGSALRALGPDSSVDLRIPPTSETRERDVVIPPPSPPPARFGSAPVAVAVGAAMVLAVGLTWRSVSSAPPPVPGSASVEAVETNVIIESLPPGLTLVDEGGRVLGVSPVTLATSASTLTLRARKDDQLSNPVQLTVHDGQLLADFGKAFEEAKTAPVPLPVVPTPPVVRAASAPRGGRPALRPAPAPAPAPVPAAVEGSPPSAPVKSPSIRLVDDQPSVGSVDDDVRPGIGLLDTDGPKVAPLD